MDRPERPERLHQNCSNSNVPYSVNISFHAILINVYQRSIFDLSNPIYLICFPFLTCFICLSDFVTFILLCYLTTNLSSFQTTNILQFVFPINAFKKPFYFINMTIDLMHLRWCIVSSRSDLSQPICIFCLHLHIP